MKEKPKLIAQNGQVISNPNAPNQVQIITIDILARTLWGEARGEGEEGMKAVACTIINRQKIAKAKGHFWWGNTIIQICQKPYQFSCWNRSDPNYQKLVAVTESDADFINALKIARRAVLDNLADITDGATHYHAAGMTPYWVKNDRPTAVIGNHIFYRLT